MTVFLLKFMNPNHIHSLEQGNLYFSPLKTFDKTNDKNDTKKINDPNEGLSFIRISSSDKTKHIMHSGKDMMNCIHDNNDGIAAEIDITNDNVKNFGVFCCTLVDTNNNKEFYQNTKPRLVWLPSNNNLMINQKFVLKPSFIKRMNSLVGGNNRIPVLMYPPFLSFLNSQRNHIQIGSVNYYDNKTKRNFDSYATNREMIMQSIFQKDSFYKEEKEFRLALLKDCSDSKNRTINIGDISNYLAYSIDNTNNMYCILSLIFDPNELMKASKNIKQSDILLIKKRMT
ncbi:hypothetical protein AKUA1805_12770 [Apilactobacillus kunkeei]|nr:hypothetical protein AKUA2101_12780 [Apilactobacillus kunkeei]CAI2652309.1 hypothetical protein AKUA1805_12770 [Apilactobacillus kunkeei]